MSCGRFICPDSGRADAAHHAAGVCSTLVIVKPLHPQLGRAGNCMLKVHPGIMMYDNVRLHRLGLDKSTTWGCATSLTACTVGPRCFAAVEL